MSENIIDNLIEEGRRMFENETVADILAEMRIFKCRNLFTGKLGLCNAIANYLADRLEASYKREIGALRQRCTELNAEVAAKDVVIKRLNDTISEEQRRKMATPENSSAVGDCAKLPKTVDTRFDICQNIALVLKIGRDYQNKDGYRGAHYDTVKLLCDAIEYQQEQLETKTEVGDVAKLREALSKFCAYSAVVLNAGMFNRVHMEALLNMAKAALAKPPRNCEKYTTVDEAMYDYADEALIEEWNALKAGKDRDMLAEELFAFTKWLFAPATEKEGGDR